MGAGAAPSLRCDRCKNPGMNILRAHVLPSNFRQNPACGAGDAKVTFRSEIWQKRFTDHPIRDADDCAGLRSYIHKNPVMRNLAAHAEEYRYCPAYPGFRVDPWPPAAEAAIEVSA